MIQQHIDVELTPAGNGLLVDISLWAFNAFQNEIGLVNLLLHRQRQRLYATQCTSYAKAQGNTWI